ncbi:hypothetical protein [Peptacetobacter hiranonis]|uniref:hypothetical protein n=1 Tax=Peptacetobacter hiranonis TaxID=89152 RepID=UPI0022E43B20|nr:hypothetical protein [Peptacetobacter hiranonis]
MKKLGSIMKMVKRSSKKILKYTAMSFIICYASAVVLRVMNAFLGANTPDFWWYFVPATLVALALSGLMVLANFDKVFRKPTKKKAVAKQKVRRKSAPAVSTPEREYRRKVS